MTPDALPPDRQTQPDAVTCTDCAVDAIVLGAALITVVQPHDPRSTHAAQRMELLACCRRAGLLDTPPRRPVLAEFDRLLQRFRRDPAHMHRVMVRTMDRLVGSPRAEEILIAIARIGVISAPLSDPGRLWLDRIRAALALEPPIAASAAPCCETRPRRKRVRP